MCAHEYAFIVSEREGVIVNIENSVKDVFRDMFVLLKEAVITCVVDHFKDLTNSKIAFPKYNKNVVYRMMRLCDLKLKEIYRKSKFEYILS